MNQRVKRAIAAAMSLTMVATATPVSPLYNAIQNAVSSVMMQASAAENKYIVNYDNDTFSIASFDDLNAFAEAVNTEGKAFSGKKVYLTADIEGFQTPIGTSTAKFMGTFDGQGHKVTLDMEKSATTDYVGLFGCVEGATIKNVNVTGSVSGKHYIGGVCGSANNFSVIDNCTNDSELSLNGENNIGGIAGKIKGATVVNCTNCTEKISPNNNYGGVVGYLSNCEVNNNVYNCMNIVTDKDCGLVGYIFNETSYAIISNCFTSGEKIYNLIGENSKNNVEFLNCYYDSGDSDKAEVNGIKGLMHDKCIGSGQGSVASILNANAEAHNLDVVKNGSDKYIWNDWTANINELPSSNYIPGFEPFVDYSRSEIIHISTIDELNIFAYLVKNDVDFAGKTVFLDADIEGFQTPIGTSTAKFMGTFDGQGHKVTLDMEKSATTDYVGLFGCVEGATIRNVTVEGSVTGSSFVGGICAQVISNSNVYNCTNNAEITGTKGMAGGICGEVRSNCNIYNCTNNKKVNGGTIQFNTGGICGELNSNCNVYNCVNNAEISGNNDVGGICGNAYTNCKVYNCINTNNTVTGTSYVGGICGSIYNKSEVDKCYLLDVEEKFNEADGVTEITAEQLAGTDKVSDNKTVTELLNEYVNSYEGDLELYSWKQNGTPKLQAPLKYTTIEGKNLKWAIDEDTLIIKLNEESKTGEQYTEENAMPDWYGDIHSPWYNNTEITSVQIGEGITAIGNLAFNLCVNLTSIAFPSSLESIGEQAFYGCIALKDVTFAEGSKLTSIGNSAFMNCTGLDAITLPDSVTSLGDTVFSMCWNLKKITAPCTLEATEYTWRGFAETVTYTHPIMDGQTHCTCGVVNKIGDKNLYYTLADNKLTIGLINPNETDTTKNAMPDWWDDKPSPWRDNSSITSVKIEDGVTKIGSDAFKGYSGLTSIAIPNSVTSFGDNAFNDCSKLSSITIPSGVTTIGGWAFCGCSALTEVTIPSGVTEIDCDAFMNCSALTSITIPASVTSISSGVFNGCSKLTEITIPSGVTSIEQDLFNGCSKLSSITIPSGVTRFYDNAFSGCTSLTSIKFEGDVPEIKDNWEEEADAFGDVGETTPAILYYPKNNASWDNLLAENAESIAENGFLSWKGGHFAAYMYDEIEGTNLYWTLDINGRLMIDTIDKNITASEMNKLAITGDEPWKNYVNQISRVVISKDVEDINDTSFASFANLENKAVIIIDSESPLSSVQKPSRILNSTYSSFGGGEFIYNTQLIGSSLSLAGKIGVNISFYVNKDEGSTITINDEEIKLEDCTSKNNIYTYTLWVAPKDAYNDITFKTEKEGLIIVNQTFNVKSNYVDAVFKDDEHETYSEDVYNMVRALDAYINSSRVYFKEVDEADADALKTSINTALASLNLSELNKYAPNIASGSVEGIKYYGSSLILNSGVKLRHYITITNEENKTNIKIMVGNTTYGSEKIKKTKVYGTDVYYFETDEFNPKDFNMNVSVLYDEENISEALSVIDNYSVLSFINLALDSSTKDTDLGITCKAIYNYYLAADTYNKN